MISDRPDNKERILSFLIFVPAYLHVLIAFESNILSYVYDDGKWLSIILLVLFTAAFIAAVEWMYHDEKPSCENPVWLGCLITITVGILLSQLHFPWGNWHDDTVFPDWEKYLSLHAFAIYWVLVRSNRLAEGHSGHMLPLDALNGSVLFPFRYLFLRIQVMFAALFSRNKNRSEAQAEPAQTTPAQTAPADVPENGEAAVQPDISKTVLYPSDNQKNAGLSSKAVAWIAGICAALVGMILLSSALRQLSSADDSFRRFFDGMTEWFSAIHFEGKYIGYAFAALPVSAYLFGLIAGTHRIEIEAVHKESAALMEGVNRAAKVKALVWGIIITVFSAFYLIFFILQAEYLFGAFIGKLPDGFIVSQYARQGFFELLRVLAINLILYWCALRTSDKDSRDSAAGRFLKVMEVLLILESMLFAVVACSKLVLYISIFGFTVKRLQSTWLVLAAFGGMLALLIHRLTGRKTARIWTIACGVSWSLLCLL